MYPFQSQNQIQTIKDKQFVKICLDSTCDWCKQTAWCSLDDELCDHSHELKISKIDEMG